MESNGYNENRDNREGRDSRQGRDSHDSREYRDYPPAKERCAVSGTCDGVCRELHLNDDGRRCPAWYTEDFRRGGRSSGRGRR